MLPLPVKRRLDRFLDVVFGEKLGGNDAYPTLAIRPPQWAFAIYAVLFWASLLVGFAVIASNLGWITFMDSRIDSIWAGAALGANMLLSSGWRWLSRRYERRAKNRAVAQATFFE